jgi:hypothetical protein
MVIIFLLSYAIIPSNQKQNKEILLNPNQKSFTFYGAHLNTPNVPKYIYYHNTSTRRVEFEPIINNKDWLNIYSIVSTFTKNSHSPKNIIMLIYYFLIENFYHSTPHLSGLEGYPKSSTQMLNSIGYGFCLDVSTIFSALSIAAGIKSRIIGFKDHAVTEVYYDNAWHMFDADKHAIYKKNDGEIASVENIFSELSILKQIPAIYKDQYSVFSKKEIIYIYDTDYLWGLLSKEQPIKYNLWPQEELRFFYNLPDKFWWSNSSFSPHSFTNGYLISPNTFFYRKFNNIYDASTNQNPTTRLLSFDYEVLKNIKMEGEQENTIQLPHPIVGIYIFTPPFCGENIDYFLSFDLNDKWTRLPINCSGGFMDLTSYIPVGPNTKPSYYYYIKSHMVNQTLLITEFQLSPKALPIINDAINTLTFKNHLSDIIFFNIQGL